jgi:uncharacterized protein
MRIFVTAKPGAKQACVERLDETHFKISVKAPPGEGRANAAVMEALAAFLKIPKSRMELIRGHKSKQKVIEIRF